MIYLYLLIRFDAVDLTVYLFYRIDTVICWRWLLMNVSMDFKLLDFMLMNITACFKLPGTKSSKPPLNDDWIYVFTNHDWTVIYLCLGHSKTNIFDSLVWSITLSKTGIPGVEVPAVDCINPLSQSRSNIFRLDAPAVVVSVIVILEVWPMKISNLNPGGNNCIN